MYISDLPAAPLHTISIPTLTPHHPWPNRLITALTRWNTATTHQLDPHLASDTGFENYTIR